jgi:hypothetical protein
MADLADQADQQNSLFDENNIKTYRKPTGPKATGYCLNCGEQFLEHERAKRWCDRACLSDWERFSK